jgi:hypothetical protein
MSSCGQTTTDLRVPHPSRSASTARALKKSRVGSPRLDARACLDSVLVVLVAPAFRPAFRLYVWRRLVLAGACETHAVIPSAAGSPPHASRARALLTSRKKSCVLGLRVPHPWFLRVGSPRLDARACLGSVLVAPGSNRLAANLTDQRPSQARQGGTS